MRSQELKNNLSFGNNVHFNLSISRENVSKRMQQKNFGGKYFFETQENISSLRTLKNNI